MKKNFFFFLMFLMSLIFVYLFEERGHIERQITKESNRQLFNPEKLGPLLGMKTPKASILKREGKFHSEKGLDLIDDVVLEEVFEVLSKIKAVRVLSTEEMQGANFSNFFPNQDYWIEFQFEKGFLKYFIGSKLNYDQSFYVQVSDGQSSQFLIAELDGQETGIYLEAEAPNSDQKYKRLMSVINLPEDFYYDRRISALYKIPLENLNSIQIESFRNRGYQVNFKSMTTDPAPIRGIELDREKVTAIKTELGLLRYTQKIFIKASKEDEILSTLTLHFDNEKKVVFNLMERRKPKITYFQVEGDSTYYELPKSSLPLFFLPHQSLWDKRPLRIQGDEEDLDLIRSGIDFIFHSKDVAHLRYSKEAPHWKVSSGTKRFLLRNKLEELFNFLNAPADMVSNATPQIKGKNYTLSVRLGTRPFSIKIEGEETIVLDESQDLLYHYWTSEPGIALSPNDYFQ